MTLSTRLSNAQIIGAAWLRRKALRLLFGKTIVVCTCGAVCDFNEHRKDHFLCGQRLSNRFRGVDHNVDRLYDRLERVEGRIAEMAQSVADLSEVEKGHAYAVADRMRFLRHRIDNAFTLIREVDGKLDAAGGLCSLGEVPAQKVQQLIERYKLVRSYVRGISERQRTLERAMGLSVTLDGPQRFKDTACELFMQVLEYCPPDTMPLLVSRIVNLLDNSGHEGWAEK